MQDLYIWQVDLSFNAKVVDLIDMYTSLLWVNRYYTAGEFELMLPVNKKYLNYVDGWHLISVGNNFKDSMFIEKIDVIDDSDQGRNMLIKGRSLLAILDRRVIHGKTIFASMSPEGILHSLIYKHVGEGAGSIRGFPGFITGPVVQTSDAITAEFNGVSVLTATSDICQQYGIGHKITANQNGTLSYSILHSTDKGVIFSEPFDNLISSNYSKDISTYCNIAYVQNPNGYYNEIFKKQKKGFERFEKIASIDISPDNFETLSDFYAALAREGYKSIKNSIINYFECEISPTTTFEYKKDFDVGDFATAITNYAEEKVRIVEIAESWNENGYTVVSTLEYAEVS